MLMTIWSTLDICLAFQVHLVDLVPDHPKSDDTDPPFLIGMGYGGEMSIGDVNLDGYPDVLTTAWNKWLS